MRRFRYKTRKIHGHKKTRGESLNSPGFIFTGAGFTRTLHLISHLISLNRRTLSADYTQKILLEARSACLADFDLARLCLFGLGKGEGKQPVGEVCTDLFLIHIPGETEAAAEAHMPAFSQKVCGF